MVETLYHLTHKDNAAAIAASGILPIGKLDKDSDHGLSSSYSVNQDLWRKETVWLTHDPYAVFSQMCANNWLSEGVVLEIDVAGLEYSLRDVYCNTKNEPIEYLVVGGVPPESITTMCTLGEWFDENNITYKEYYF